MPWATESSPRDTLYHPPDVVALLERELVFSHNLAVVVTYRLYYAMLRLLDSPI